MPLADRCGDPLDLVAIADVAGLLLGSQFFRDRAQTLLATGEEDESPAPPCERACDRGADAARAAGDDRNRGRRRFYRQTLTFRRA